MGAKQPVAVRIDRAENPPRWIMTILEEGEAFALAIPGRGEERLLEVLAPGERDTLLGWWRTTAWIAIEDLLAILTADVEEMTAAG
ncbi:MAG: hypothetical protein JXP34_04825 [Planctomycetes bacterium]|nr:hypothetical protein [Planctomycetota bacterium]